MDIKKPTKTQNLDVNSPASDLLPKILECRRTICRKCAQERGENEENCGCCEGECLRRERHYTAYALIDVLDELDSKRDATDLIELNPLEFDSLHCTLCQEPYGQIPPNVPWALGCGHSLCTGCALRVRQERSECEKSLHDSEKTYKIICYKCQLQSCFTADRQDADFLLEILQKLKDLPISPIRCVDCGAKRITDTVIDCKTCSSNNVPCLLCAKCALRHHKTHEIVEILDNLKNDILQVLDYEIKQRTNFENFDPKIVDSVEALPKFLQALQKQTTNLKSCDRFDQASEIFQKTRAQVDQFEAISKAVFEDLDAYNRKVDGLIEHLNKVK